MPLQHNWFSTSLSHDFSAYFTTLRCCCYQYLSHRFRFEFKFILILYTKCISLWDLLVRRISTHTVSQSVRLFLEVFFIHVITGRGLEFGSINIILPTVQIKKQNQICLLGVGEELCAALRVCQRSFLSLLRMVFAFQWSSGCVFNKHHWITPKNWAESLIGLKIPTPQLFMKLPISARQSPVWIKSVGLFFVITMFSQDQQAVQNIHKVFRRNFK